MATAAVSITQSVLSTFTGLFRGHEIRAADARNENQAVASVIPQWDSYFKAIIAGYNSGEATPDQCLQALEAMDQQTQQTLHSFVGKPGTSWDNKPAQRCGDPAAAICDKTCTVGCCIYKAYLSRPTDCAFKAIQSGTVRTVTRGTIQGSKYGLPTFPSYTLQIGPPAKASGDFSDPFSTLQNALGVGGGSGQTLIGGGYAQPGALQNSIYPPPDYTKLLLYGGGLVLLLILLTRRSN